MAIWQRLSASGVKREETLVPSQSVIGEIKMASTVRTKPLRTVRSAESPGSVQTQPRESVQFPTQSVIGEINLRLLSYTVRSEPQLCWHETPSEQNQSLRPMRRIRCFAVPARRETEPT